MKILFVTHYFLPEVGAPQTRISDLAGHWSRIGSQVTILTGMPNHPTGIIPDDYRNVARRIERSDEYKVVRTWLYATPNQGFARRTLGHLSFMLSSVVLGNRSVGSADVVVVSSPTFFSIGSAWVLAKLKRAKFVIEIRDLWPAVFVDLGVLTFRPLISLLKHLELAAYRAADGIVVVTHSFADNIEARGIPREKITVIANGAETDVFSPPTVSPAKRSQLGAKPDETIITYMGAHGISQGLQVVVEAAKILKEHPFHFAFIGEGADKERISEMATKLGLTNVSMLASVPRNQVPGIIAASDICLVPLRDLPLFSTFIPSKMFEFLAMEKAVIGGLRGEAADILTEAGGCVVEPENPHQLAEAILRLALDPQLRESMGKKGGAFVRGNFNRRELAERYHRLLQSLVFAS